MPGINTGPLTNQQAKCNLKPVKEADRQIKVKVSSHVKTLSRKNSSNMKTSEWLRLIKQNWTIQ